MTTEQRHSTNGHMRVAQEAAPQPDAEAREPRPRGAGRLLMPALLALTALIIIRRMQRGSVV